VKKNKIIGLVLVVPLLILIVKLLLSPGLWAYAILNLVTTGMAMVGMHVFKGFSIKEAVKEVIKELLDQDCKPNT
jgi:uncharacterized membrane protein